MAGRKSARSESWRAPRARETCREGNQPLGWGRNACEKMRAARRGSALGTWVVRRYHASSRNRRPRSRGSREPRYESRAQVRRCFARARLWPARADAPAKGGESLREAAPSPPAREKFWAAIPCARPDSRPEKVRSLWPGKARQRGIAASLSRGFLTQANASWSAAMSRVRATREKGSVETDLTNRTSTTRGGVLRGRRWPVDLEAATPRRVHASA
jgi:hypothetical protein